MKIYKAMIYKYGSDEFDLVTFKAKDFEHFWAEIENFCRRSAIYAEWKFVGIDDEV